MKTNNHKRSWVFTVLTIIMLCLSAFTSSAQTISGPSTVNQGSINDYTLSGVTVTSWNVSGAANWTTISGGVRVTAGSGNFTVSASFTQAPNYTAKFVTVTPLGPAKPGNPTVSINNCQVTLTRSGTPPAGVTWYWQGRSNNGQITTLGSGPTYIANSGSGNYYIQARNSSGQWSTTSGVVNVSIPSPPVPPSVTNASRSICPGQATTFTVNNPVGTSTYRWYTSAGAWVSTGTSYTVSPSSSATYQVREISNVGCFGNARDLSVTVNSIPSLSVTNQSNTCNSTSIQVTANSNNVSGISHVWYTSATGNGTVTPTVVSTVGQYVTGFTVNAQTQSFWVAAKVGSCEGPRKKVTATFNDNSEVPTLNVGDFSTGSNSCGNGSFDLRASGGQPGSIYRWYATATGGSPLFTGSNYVFNLNYANTSNGQKTYYVNGSLVNTAGCTKEITTRVPITVTVEPLPSVAVGNDTPSCGVGPVILNALPGANANTIRWYTSATGGNVLATGTSFTTPSLTTTTSYYAESYDSSGQCSATTRKEIRAVIGTTPSLTVNDAQNDCFSTDIQVTASSTNVTGISHVWYTSATGNATVSPTVISTVGQYVTGFTVNNQTQSFWVAPKVGNCEGPRQEVTATYTDNSDTPTLSVGDFTSVNTGCGSGTFDLRASGGQPGSLYRWYDQAVNGTQVSSDQNYSPTLTYGQTTNGQKTYWVEATLVNTSGCSTEITNRQSVTVTVNPIPLEATGSDVTSSCGPAALTLSANPGQFGTQIRWYTTPTGGNPLVSDNATNYTTDVLSATTSFYAESFNEITNCASATRVKIDAIITPGPSITVSQNARNICPSTDIKITAMTTNVGNVEHFWWNDPVLNDPISTYQVEDTGGVGGYVTYLLVDGLGLTNGTRTYWVSATIDGCTTERVPVTATYVDDCGGTGGEDCIASGVSNIFFPTAGGSESFTIDWNLPQCEETVYLKTNSFENPPVWLGVTKNPGNNFVLTVGQNDSGVDNIVSLLLVNELGEAVGQLSFNVTQPTCSNQVWYPDNDLDNEGDPFEEPVTGCSKPYGNWTMNPYSGGSTGEDLNWILTRGYDVANTYKVSSKTYFDDLGKPMQSQSWNVKTDSTWASEILYDPQGRPAINTLSAPIREGSNFLYKSDFVKQTDNSTNYNFSNYTGGKLENPDAVGNAPSTLGWYYSENNDREGYQDITDHPFSKTIYSTLMPGSALRGIGGNKVDSDGDGTPDTWPQGYTFSMRASQELAQTSAFGDTQYNSKEIVKTVSRDVHGVENVLFNDTDGKTLAAARSGGATSRSMTITVEDQGYVDIHVPQGTNMGFTVNTSGVAVTVYDLITETTITPSNSLPNGFYRVAVNDPDTYVPGSVQITYMENYYDYSLNEFDSANRLIASYQPLNKLKTEYQYNTLGQLVYTKSPDEGEAWFKYREDGQIRFSQNSKQKFEASPQEFSYTNYDGYGRPIESGVLISSAFDTADPDVATLPSGATKEVTTTVYDALAVAELQTLPSAYQNPSHLSGNVAKTYNDQSTSYYSYDIYGRVQWMVQIIQGLGTKTIDYTYDEVTGQILEVVYQKGDTAEEFTHFYTYNTANQLVKVETAPYGAARTLNAEYVYYETGALKRKELAGGVQGMDYVYNLGGQLKSMNHPSLSPTQDPGGDTNDLFGMQLDYHNADYKRAVGNISSQTYGTELFNGNIKGIRWNNAAVPGNTGEQKYSYAYDRNNWLIAADFEGNGNNTSGIQADDSSTSTYLDGESFDLQATNSFTLLPGFHAQQGSNGVIRIVEDTGTGGNPGDYDVTNITYDANGNIQSLRRNKNTSANSNAMDDLGYVYRTDKPNQLLRVDDAAGDAVGADDIDDQNGDNYVYNSIGQLITNTGEGIGYVYNASGLVTQVIKNNVTLVKFFYNDRNHRMRKESYASGILQSTTHYVRDVSGSVMGVYNQLPNATVNLIEQPVYGAARLAIYYRQSDTNVYELTDHLGNVRAAFAVTGGGSYDTRSGTDYYPFGMPMPGRNLVGDYRYAFQGQEKDLETGKEAFELRLWDSRIGRWLTTDPAGQYASPYLGMGNNPLNGVDPDGAFWEELGNWFKGNGWNSNAALDYQSNGGTLGDWVGNKFTGFRSAGSTIDGEFVGTTFDAVNDFKSGLFSRADIFGFEGRVAVGKSLKLSGDIGSNYVKFGFGGSGTFSRMMFLGGDYGFYWYDYAGLEGGANFGASLAVAPIEAQIAAESEFVIGIYLGERSSPSPKGLAGLSGSLDGAIDGDIIVDLSLGAGVTISGQWLLFNATVGVGLDTTPSIGVNGDVRIGHSTLLTPIKPTVERTFRDMLSNHLSLLIY